MAQRVRVDEHPDEGTIRRNVRVRDEVVAVDDPDVLGGKREEQFGPFRSGVRRRLEEAVQLRCKGSVARCWRAECDQSRRAPGDGRWGVKVV